MSNGSDWETRPEGFVRFGRLDRNGEDGIDLRRCRRYVVEYPSEEDPSGDLRILYMTPDGRWVQLHGCLCPWDGEWMESFGEVDPVEAAHRIWVNDRVKHRLPPELEPFRDQANYKGYAEWLSRDEMFREAEEEQEATPVEPSPIVQRAGPEGYVNGYDESLTLSEILQLGWDLHKWILDRLPLLMEEWEIAHGLRTRKTAHQIANLRFCPWSKLFFRAGRRLSNYRGNILAGRWDTDDLDEEMLQAWLVNAIDTLNQNLSNQEYDEVGRHPAGIPIENLNGFLDVLRRLESHILNGGPVPRPPDAAEAASGSNGLGVVESEVKERPPAETTTDGGETDASANDGRTPAGPQPARLIEVQRLDGKRKTVDLNGATRWPSFPKGDIDTETSWSEDLYSTPKGRWFILTAYKIPSVVWEEWQIPPPDEACQVTIERAVQWFINDWDRFADGNSGIPEEIRRRISESDIDSNVTDPVEETGSSVCPTSAPAPTQPKEARDAKRWNVIRVYHDRLRRNFSVSVRNIAQEAGCSTGYASKVMQRLKSNSPDRIPKGSKDRDGRIEACG